MIQKCATCKVDIGGLDHNPLAGNVDLDDKLKNNTNYSQVSKVDDKSERNYCLRPAGEDKDAFDTVRSLPPVTFRAMRFIMHAALVVGAVSSSYWTNAMGQVINKAYTNPKDLPTHFTEHVQNDWKMLRAIIRRSEDDVAMLMHTGLLAAGSCHSAAGADLISGFNQLSNLIPNVVNFTPTPAPAAPAPAPAPAPANAAGGAAAAAAAGGAGGKPQYLVLAKLEERGAWEAEFNRIVLPLIDSKNVQTRLGMGFCIPLSLSPSLTMCCVVTRVST